MQEEPRYWVFMGDIIGSSNLDPRRIMPILNELVEYVNESLASEILSPLTITLGDEFQSVAASLEGATRALLLCDRWLLFADDPFKMRFVIHEGKIETPINPERAHGMLGPALTNARQSLTALKKETHRRITVHLQDEVASEQMNLCMNLYSSIRDRWTKSQKPVVRAFLQHGDYKEVARDLGKTASQMWKREHSLRISDYHDIRRLATLIAQNCPP